LIKPEVKERIQADKNAVVDILKLLKYKLKRTSTRRYYEKINDGLSDSSDGQITQNLNTDESSSDSFNPILLAGNSMESKYNFNKKTVTKPLESSDSNTFKNDGLMTVSPPKVLIEDIAIATGENLKKLEVMKRRFQNTGTYKAS